MFTKHRNLSDHIRIHWENGKICIDSDYIGRYLFVGIE